MPDGVTGRIPGTLGAVDARICLLPGDGIGPEVTTEAVRVLERLAALRGHTFRIEPALIGGAALDARGTSLPEETVALARASDAVLFGAIGGPKWDDPRASDRPEIGLLRIRKELNLFANIRPVRLTDTLIEASTIRPEVLAGTDIVVIRELTGGLYYGERTEPLQPRGERWAADALVYSEAEVERVIRVAFELARTRRRRVASVDKANVLATSRLWRTIATEVAAEYPDVELEHVLVDAMTMFLIRTPSRFDVVVTENMFGDILTDEASELTGSLGMLPSASLGDPLPGRTTRFGLYEPIHGSAPDLAGRGVANPLATIASAALLLRYSLGLEEDAALVEAAIEGALATGVRTADLARNAGRVVGTQEMGAAVVAALERLAG